MKNITPRNLTEQLEAGIDGGAFVPLVNALVRFLRRGGRKHAPQRLDMLTSVLRSRPDLAARFANLLYGWLGTVHIYPALVMLGIFSRSGFTREMGLRLYERFSPSYKDLDNLRDVFLYLFHAAGDENWLNALSIRQWLQLHDLLLAAADKDTVQTASRQLLSARLQAIEMLSVWVAAEALESELVRISPRLLEADSAFVALQRETAKLVEHYRNGNTPYDTAHIEVMFDQCVSQVEYLRRRGTGAGSGSSVKVAHLLERLNQTLGRLKTLIDIQTQTGNSRRLSVVLIHSLVHAAVEQFSTRRLRKSSVKMLSKSITENKSGHGGHYITRDRREYFAMLRSAAGGGILIALMALNKIHIAQAGFGEFATSLLAGLNYGLGFMLIHVLHFTVATKQPAMTAASFAEQVERSDTGRAVNMKLARLLIDVSRSQSVAVFGNMALAAATACAACAVYAAYTGRAVLDSDGIRYQLDALDPLSPALWYAAIAGVWLFCSGIIAGFFDNRADYLDLRRRLMFNPLLRRIMPKGARSRLAGYIHTHYGSLAGNFIFGMLLGMTGYVGHITGLPLDIRHVAFSSANLGYAAASGSIGAAAFLYGLAGALAIGIVNLLVSFTLALFVALRARDSKIDSIPKLLHCLWIQVKANPLMLLFPVSPDGAKPVKSSRKNAD